MHGEADGLIECSAGTTNAGLANGFDISKHLSKLHTFSF